MAIANVRRMANRRASLGLIDRSRHVKLNAGAHVGESFSTSARVIGNEKKLDDDRRNKTCGKTCYRLTLRERRAILEDQ